jgi:hypothetical protein
LAFADGAQVALKALTHEFLFRGSGRYLDEEDQKKFAIAHHNAWLVDFKRSFAARDAKCQAWLRRWLKLAAISGTWTGGWRQMRG